MANLTLSFHGLCAFINRGSYYDVILPTAMGHRATLMVRTEFIKSTSNWDPDFIGGVPTGAAPGGAKVDQIAGWYLDGLTTFSGASANTVRWPNRGVEAIDFAVYHTNYSVHPTPTNVPVIVLPGGTGSCPKKDAITLKKKGTVVGSRDFGTVVEWEGLPMVLRNDRGGEIQFQVDHGNRDAFATVTNVAAVMHAMPGMPATKAGLGHFAVYYDYVDLDLTSDSPMDLSAALGEVYDCVPPAPLS